MALALGSSMGPVLAHPLSEHPHFPLSPWVTAILVAAIVSAAALIWPARPNVSQKSDPVVASWAEQLSRAQIVARVIAVVLLVFAIVAGRVGEEDELDNLAPALIIGVGWPLLVLGSVSLGAAWRWVDPWDGIARVVSPGDPKGAESQVWPAVAFALIWVWYLSAYPTPLDPRSIGALLALYSVVIIAGCLALGRGRWLSSAEPLGILLSWMALAPRRALEGWQPPRGADVLLGVLAGGVLFGAARRSALWGELNSVPAALGLATIGVSLASAAVAGLLWAATRIRREVPEQSVIRATVPALAGIIVAVALDRSRLLTSLQLLPRLLFDPFGLGWDPLGVSETALAHPLSDSGMLFVQLAVLLAGQVVGAIVMARSTPPGQRGRASGFLAFLSAVSVIAIVTY
ncbi:MAG: hypothetical protein ACRDKF_10440 [Actinomycetota bacterium]